MSGKVSSIRQEVSLDQTERVVVIVPHINNRVPKDHNSRNQLLFLVVVVVLRSLGDSDEKNEKRKKTHRH